MKTTAPFNPKKTLQDIFKALSSKNLAKQVDAKHHKARRVYRISKNVVDSYDEFMDVIENYAMHHEATIFGKRQEDLPFPKGHAKGHALQALEKHPLSFQHAKDSTQNGIHGVLDIIADYFRNRELYLYRLNALEGIGVNTFEKRKSLMDAYLKQFAGHLGEEWEGISAVELVTNWKSVLITHVQAMEAIRDARLSKSQS